MQRGRHAFFEETQVRTGIRYLRDNGMLVLNVGKKRFAIVEVPGAPFRDLRDRAQALVM